MGYEALSDYSSAVDYVAPAAVTTATWTSTWLDMAKYNKVKYTVLVGAVGSNSTIQPTILQATDTSGTGSKAVTLTGSVTASQITASNTVSVYNVAGSQLDAANNFRYVRASVVVATASAVMGVLAEGYPESTPPTTASFANQVVV
jgi:hypothetical protein